MLLELMVDWQFVPCFARIKITKMKLRKFVSNEIYFIVMLIQMGIATYLLVQVSRSGNIIVLIVAIIIFIGFSIFWFIIMPLKILEFDWRKHLQKLKITR